MFQNNTTYKSDNTMTAKKIVKKTTATKKLPTRRKISCSKNQQGDKLYKVLYDGCSPGVGGAARIHWDLPRPSKPGKWQEVKGKLHQCHKGLHVTSQPNDFINQYDCQFTSYNYQLDRSLIRVYEVQVEGMEGGARGESKVVCQRVRLLREVKGAALERLS